MAERVKYLLDEHVPSAVTSGLRSRGVDVVTVQECGAHAASDEDLLNLAVAEGRVIFTQDADFLRLHAAGHPHVGIVYAHQETAIRDVIRGLRLIYQVLDPSDMRDHVEFL